MMWTGEMRIVLAVLSVAVAGWPLHSAPSDLLSPVLGLRCVSFPPSSSLLCTLSHLSTVEACAGGGGGVGAAAAAPS